jgi:hypothetical protein
LNAGDNLHDHSVLEQVGEIIQSQSADFYYGNIMGVNANGRRSIGTFLEPVSLHYFLRWFVPHPASFIKRQLLVSLGGYAQHYRILSDWLFSVQAFLRGHRFQHLPIIVSDFYNDGISSTQLDVAAGEKKAVFENELAFLEQDRLWHQKMRLLELSRPVQWLVRLLALFKSKYR